MNISYFKTGLFATVAIALLSACNTTPETQPTTVATATTTTATATTSPTASQTASPTISFFGQREKAIESSGRIYLKALARGQQAFFLEKSKFSATIDDIGLGIKAEDNYYLLQVVDSQPKSATMTATAKQDNVKSFTASVFAVGKTGSETTITIVCGTDIPSKTPPKGIIAPKSETDKPTCPKGSSPVDK